uniref:PARCEL domain protein n=1 Tax=Mycoplasma feriruminatoris TaxID=1179777 RepID=A0A654IM47_9MOLU|nr:hypothetical protein MF5582_00183 [Mycoplasma feriruminatoris]
MKKLLTILTSISAIFLVTASVILINKNKKDNTVIYNAITYIKTHKRTGNKLTEIGYYRSGNKVIIQQIPTTVTVIDAELPKEITSLRNAFYGNRQGVKWEKTWDTSNITDMSSVFYDANWINDPSIKNWNTSKVTDMSKMFKKAKSFNQDLSGWDISNVKNFEGMFHDASDFNNGNQPLTWGNKLKNANNFKNMFKDATSFKYNLNDWKITKKVDNSDFGLEENKQPKWFIETDVPTIPETPRTQSNNDSSTHSDLSSNNVTENSVPESSIKNSDNIQSPNISETNTYKIPSARTNTIKLSKSSNTGAIVGSILGTFTILGIGAGVGYYYRSPLKNSFFKSKDWIKDKLSKIKSK